jgi:murein L,D-transpeptidase YcbB/YkuD
MHDTPTKQLFARPRRAYSHGCVRVENPARLGELLLSIANPKESNTAEGLEQAWGGPERSIKFRRKIPVHLVYMSAYVDGEGKLVVRDDIYHLDQKVTAILKGDDRRMADSYAAPAPKPTVIDAEKRRELERFVPNAFGAREGFGFLDRLFR